VGTMATMLAVDGVIDGLVTMKYAGAMFGTYGWVKWDGVGYGDGGFGGFGLTRCSGAAFWSCGDDSVCECVDGELKSGNGGREGRR
jgi:hypothetical protein